MKRKTANIKVKKLGKPRERLVRTLLLKSKALTFEVAKREWSLVTVIRKEDDAFVHHCQLCGARNYEQNILISNEINNSELKVGIDCASRFLLLNGCQDAEDVMELIQQKIEESSLEHELITLYQIIRKAPHPPKNEVFQFRRKLLIYLTIMGQARKQYKKEDLEEILETILDCPNFTDADISLLNLIIKKQINFNQKVTDNVF